MSVIFAIILLCCCSLFAFGQSKPADNKPTDLEEKRPATISLLSSYYGQDGDHSAVNGGRGSQNLESFTQEAAIFIPVRNGAGLKVHGGVDHFTSASLRTIDKYKTSASAAEGTVSKNETRTYGSVGYDLPGRRGKSLHSPLLGFSTEYDVNSVSAGYSWTRFLPKTNMVYQLGGTFVADRWLMIYPGEFRTQVMGHKYVAPATTDPGSTSGSNTGSGNGSGGGSGHKMTSSHSDKDEDEDEGGSHTTGASENNGGSGTTYTTGASTDTANWVETPVGYAKPIEVTGKTATKNGKTYPVDWRYSWAITNSLSYVVNERMDGAVGLDIMGQWGLLSTPFYRVYFSDGITDELDKQVAIEKLPRQRLKAALYARFNYQFTDRTTLRLWARGYSDTWDVKAISATVEVPVKIIGGLSVNPFYRIHTQRASEYFQPYEYHLMIDDYYTSDYDLSAFTAHKIGGAIRFSPLKPLFSLYNSSAASIFMMPSVGFRYAYYMRSDGLTSHAASLELNFQL